MHAIVGIWTADESRRVEQDRVALGLAARPGFVSGYWMRDPETGKAHSVSVFVSEAHARAFKEHLAASSRGLALVGVTADVVALVEVCGKVMG